MCRLCNPMSRELAGPSGAVMMMAAGGGGTSSDGKAHRTNANRLPEGLDTPGRRILIKGGAVLSMDDAVGNFAIGDVLVDGAKIVEVGRNIDADDATVVDAAGKIVMPGFVDTHHHQFETALRSQLANGILINDGRPSSKFNYYELILQTFSMVYRPEDVYINVLFGSIAQLDAGVTTVMDVSQIHHSPEHSDAVYEGLRDAGRRSVFGYFEGWGDNSKYPGDAARIRERYFPSDDQLQSMVMGGEIYIPNYEAAWTTGRDLDLPIALHVVGTFGMQPTFDELAKSGQFGSDNIFIHMTGMSDLAWKHAADAGAHVSLSVPIEMQMRHGMPPVQKALDHGMGMSLSSDVECTMTADPFTQMRSLLTLQRSFANEKALGGEDYPELLNASDAVRTATLGGARGLKLDHKTGSLTPGKEADIILLDTDALNVTPLNNVPGAIATLMDRTNVDTVFVAGEVKKWKGQLLGFDIPKLKADLERSRDYLFETAGVERDLFAS